MRRLLCFVLFLGLGGAYTHAQQVFNNDSVIKLVKAGLSEDLIITTISSQAGAYDVSPDGIISLKGAGVSDKVIAAILQKASAPIASPPTPIPVATTENTTPAASPQPATAPNTKPRVYVSTVSHGNNIAAVRNQAMEVSKDIEKHCPGIQITINSDAADYTILLNHIEVGLLIRDNQIQVANKNGDLISATKEGRSINTGSKRACETILADWSKKN